MAKNISYNFIDQVTLPVTEGTKSGDPVVVGGLVGVAVNDRDSDGNSEVKIKGAPAVAVSVKAIDVTGDSAVAKGDKIYLVDADTPKLSKKATGTLYGYAYGTITAGGTATIDVILA